MNAIPTLHLLCGKMAAGKSTLARALANQHAAVLLVEDELLDALYPEEIVDLPGYVKYSTRLKSAIAAHVCALLRSGVSVVLDFPGNTHQQRQWFRQLIEAAGCAHLLHHVIASDELCKRQLRQRSAAQTGNPQFGSDAVFDQITAYFQAPSPNERFTIVVHARE